jgi:nitrite reductase (NADH) large subunit
VVVGNGMVALRFMEKILEKDTHKMYKLVCFGDEQYPAYDRVQVHTR